MRAPCTASLAAFAALAAGCRHDPESWQPLLLDRDPFTQLEAALVLCEAEPKIAQAAFAVLADHVDDEPRSQGRAAYAAALRAGKRALPLLLERVIDDDFTDGTRRNLLDIVLRRGGEAEAALGLSAFARARGLGFGQFRGALTELARRHPLVLERQVEQCLGADEKGEGALDAMLKAFPREVGPILVGGLVPADPSEPPEPSAAARFLCAEGNRAKLASSPLLERFVSGTARERRGALAALLVADPTGDGILLGLRRIVITRGAAGRGEAVRAAACVYLGRMARGAGGGSREDEQALETLGPQAIPGALDALGDEDASVRRAAATWLARQAFRGLCSGLHWSLHRPIGGTGVEGEGAVGGSADER